MNYSQNYYQGQAVIVYYSTVSDQSDWSIQQFCELMVSVSVTFAVYILKAFQQNCIGHAELSECYIQFNGMMIIKDVTH